MADTVNSEMTTWPMNHAIRSPQYKNDATEFPNDDSTNILHSSYLTGKHLGHRPGLDHGLQLASSLQHGLTLDGYSDDLNVDREEHVYESIIRWFEHEQNEREVHLPEIFAKCIRFPLMEDTFIEKIPPQFAQAITKSYGEKGLSNTNGCTQRLGMTASEMIICFDAAHKHSGKKQTVPCLDIVTGRVFKLCKPPNDLREVGILVSPDNDIYIAGGYRPSSTSRNLNQETSVPKQEVYGEKIKAVSTVCQALRLSLMASSSEDTHTVITIHRQASDTPLGARTQRSRYLQLALAGRTGLELAPRSPSFPLSTLGLRTAPGVVAARLAEPVSVFAARSGPGSGAAGTRRRSRRLHLLAAAAPEPCRLAHGDAAQRAGSLWHPGGGSRPRGAPPRTQDGDRSKTEDYRNSTLPDHLDFLRKHTCLTEFNPQYYQKMSSSFDIPSLEKAFWPLVVDQAFNM
ncbi:hypothetical protein ACRRTK_015513 [Alexandromys fortis]